MTAARTPDLTAVERAQIDAWEAAAHSEDALRERVARAISDVDCAPDHGWPPPWDEVEPALQDHYRRLADAALSVVRTPVEASR